MSYYSKHSYVEDGEDKSATVPSEPNEGEDYSDEEVEELDHSKDYAEGLKRREERRENGLPPTSAALYKAIMRTDVAAVWGILAGAHAPPRFHRCRGSGDNPLHAAARVGNVKIGRVLLDYLEAHPRPATSSNVEVVDGETKTYFATRHRDGRYDKLRHWVDGLAGGWTPIGVAMRAGHTVFAEFLAREAGANPVAMTRQGPCAYPALSYALYHTMRDVAEALMTKGEADILTLGPRAAVELVLLEQVRGKSLLSKMCYGNMEESLTLQKSLEVLQRWLKQEKASPTSSQSNEFANETFKSVAAQVLTTRPHYFYGHEQADDFRYSASLEAASACIPELLRLVLSIEEEFLSTAIHHDRPFLKKMIESLLVHPGWYSSRLYEVGRVPCVKIALSLGCDVPNNLVPCFIVGSREGFVALPELVQAMLDAGMDASDSISDDLTVEQQQLLRTIIYPDTNCM